MESQSQYPELKNNPEYFHPCIYNENEIPVGSSIPFIGENFKFNYISDLQETEIIFLLL